MAAAFLAGHGLDLDAIVQDAYTTSLQASGQSSSGVQSFSLESLPPPQSVTSLAPVALPGRPGSYRVSVSPTAGTITNIEPLGSTDSTGIEPVKPIDITGIEPARPANITGIDPVGSTDSTSPLLLPSLCHPHIHLDKPYLLTDPATAHLQPKENTFAEALSLTSAAKKEYSLDSLLARGQRLLADSARAGVTHARAFVELDPTVNNVCLEAGIRLKHHWRHHLHVQLCAFAQDPVLSGESAEGTRQLLENAAADEQIEVIGSTPYVESSLENIRDNVSWAVRLAVQHRKHLDLHLDYHLDAEQESQVWHVIDTLEVEQWTSRNPGKTVCLGHCTRITLFSPNDWMLLRKRLADLPVYFIGLPTSDLFMMGRPKDQTDMSALAKAAANAHDRPRGTLQLPAMQELGLGCALGTNNVGNAFTPWGSVDPLRLASLGVGIYQLGTNAGAEQLYGLVSTNAFQAIGLASSDDSSEEGDHPVPNEHHAHPRLQIQVGNRADLVCIGSLRVAGDGQATCQTVQKVLTQPKRSIAELIWDPPIERAVLKHGRLISMD